MLNDSHCLNKVNLSLKNHTSFSNKIANHLRGTMTALQSAGQIMKRFFFTLNWRNNVLDTVSFTCNEGTKKGMKFQMRI